MAPSSSPALLAFGTAVPEYQYQQRAVGEWIADALNAPPPLRRWTKRLYELSGIETRYSCLPDGYAPPAESRFSPGVALEDTPTTLERMTIYQRAAVQIGVQAAQRALAEFAGSRSIASVTDTVTHLIVTSCTGFFAPGLDAMIAYELGLRPTTQRTLVGFMGCAAAFNALHLARQIATAQPDARVLIVSVELCSLHIQTGTDRINMVVGSLFADGAAACLVGQPGADAADHFSIGPMHSEIVPATGHEMVWQVGNHGFLLHLSPDIPQHIGVIAPRALDALRGAGPLPQFWAIHPGGRAIVDRLVEVFALDPRHVQPSLNVLRDYGNMSSPTILFVLREMREQLRQTRDGPVQGVAMAFGPGLVIEMAQLTYVPARPSPPPEPA